MRAHFNLPHLYRAHKENRDLLAVLAQLDNVASLDLRVCRDNLVTLDLT